mgnify:CR=1 FL=1
MIILLSFIIIGHPDWKKANIKIFDIVKQENKAEIASILDEIEILKQKLTHLK